MTQKTNTIGLIGGTGLNEWGAVTETLDIETPFGAPSAPISVFELQQCRLLFLPRHGHGHTIPPHRVNYRANIAALQQAGAEQVIAVNAVGGIFEDCPPGRVCLPDQLIDYTWGRAHTYSDSQDDELQHVEFAKPFDEGMRNALLQAAASAAIQVNDSGCIGVTQGPRLETAAEVLRLANDGCDLVGMTTMPEAALARELGMPYATVCVVANWAAGVSDEPITMEAIDETVAAAMTDVRQLIATYLAIL